MIPQNRTALIEIIARSLSPSAWLSDMDVALALRPPSIHLATNMLAAIESAGLRVVPTETTVSMATAFMDHGTVEASYGLGVMPHKGIRAAIAASPYAPPCV